MRSKRRKELACPERGGGCEQSEQTEGLKKKVASLGIVNPSVTACAVPAPRPGSLLGAPYKLRHKTNTGTASRPHSLTNFRVHPPSGGFHIAQAIFHCASAQFHPASAGFHCGREPAYPRRPLAWRSISSTTMSYISPREAQYSSTFHGSLVW